MSNQKKYAELRSRHTKLENDVHEILEQMVRESKIISEKFKVPSIEIDTDNYIEIIWLDNQLQLVDYNYNLSHVVMLSLDEELEIIGDNC